MNPVRTLPTSLGAKSKKQLKNKNRGQQQGQSSMNNISSNQNNNTVNEKDKGSPVKDFAGISTESIRLHAEKSERLSEEACNLLTEDINYKLRHIIHDCLIKSKLQGRDVITSDDVDESFSTLRVDKVYGAPSSPNWLRARQDNTLYNLDDKTVNLIELAENDFNASQEGDFLIDREWLLGTSSDGDNVKEYNEAFSEYFETMCSSVISDSEEMRRMAWADISTNPSIGPITDWFYHFSYFLLAKDVTYDRLTMRALQLLEVLENSPLPSLHVYGKPLRLFVRLLLQKLLMTTPNDEIVRHTSYVLSLFCLRIPLKDMVLKKLEEKLEVICECMMMVPLLNILYFVGIDAIKRIFLPHLDFFLANVVAYEDPSMIDIVLAIYGLLCKANLNIGPVHNLFFDTLGNDVLTPYYRPKCIKADYGKREIDIVKMRKNLIKTRRKVDYRNKNTRVSTEIFETTPHNCAGDMMKLRKIDREEDLRVEGISFKVVEPYCCRMRKKIIERKLFDEGLKARRETQVTIGKTSLLLPILKRETSKMCYDHSLLPYCL